MPYKAYVLRLPPTESHCLVEHYWASVWKDQPKSSPKARCSFLVDKSGVEADPMYLHRNVYYRWTEMMECLTDSDYASRLSGLQSLRLNSIPIKRAK